MARTDCSIDLETLHNSHPEAKILTIGLQFFDRKTGAMFDSLYLRLDRMKVNGKTNGDTYDWWMDQTETAREEAFGGKTDPAIAISRIQHMFARYGNDVRVWGKGSIFDVVILESFLRNHGNHPTPWHFSNVMDIRTVMDYANIRTGSVPFVGELHNAIDDAKHQAKLVIEATRILWRL